VAFEHSLSGGCELHKAHITTFLEDDGVVCWSMDPLPTTDTSEKSKPKPPVSPANATEDTSTKQWTLLGEGECRPPSGETGTGVEYADAENALECWQKCDETEACVAYDWTDSTMFTGGSCRWYKVANHASGECGVQCWGLLSMKEATKKWKFLGNGACRTDDTYDSKEVNAHYNGVNSSGACQYACSSLDSCTAFEYSESGGCELHKSHITKYESDDGVKCWCDTSICGTKSVGDEQIISNGDEEDSNTLTIVLIILVVIAVVGLVGLGAAMISRKKISCSCKRNKLASEVVGQPVQEADQI